MRVLTLPHSPDGAASTPSESYQQQPPSAPHRAGEGYGTAGFLTTDARPHQAFTQPPLSLSPGSPEGNALYQGLGDVEGFSGGDILQLRHQMSRPQSKTQLR